MYNDDTRETYVERRKAENLAQAERSYEINGSHRNVWIFLFQWAMAEEEYGDHWDKIHMKKPAVSKSKTPEPLYRQYVPEEDRGKVVVSKYYRVGQNMDGLGVSLHPYLVECNIRIDFDLDGGIYKVEWSNKILGERNERGTIKRMGKSPGLAQASDDSEAT